jgi:uncharacterized membrane protein YkvA (DUF1232 family)
MQPDSDILNSEKIFLPAVIAQNARTVHERFWTKLRKVAGRIPFTEEIASAWYCVSDPATPARAKAILLAALAYFVAPVDAIPDFIAGIGFTDDAAVLAIAIGLVSSNIKPQHREKARSALGLPRAGGTG